LKNAYVEVLESIKLVNRDANSAYKYLVAEIKNRNSRSSSTENIDEKKAYYDISIDLYLLYFNLISSENDNIKARVLGKLASASGIFLVHNVPSDIMLTFVYILTQAEVFFSSDGHRKLLNTNTFIDIFEKPLPKSKGRKPVSFTNSRVGIQSQIDKFYNKRSKANINFPEELSSIMFISKDGTRDETRFLGHICEYISIFFVQYIIYNIKTQTTSFPVSEPDATVTPIPVNITTDDLDIIKKMNAQIPYYANQHYTHLRALYFDHLQRLFSMFNVGIDITVCIENIEKSIFERFTNSGSSTIVRYDTESKEFDTQDLSKESSGFFPVVTAFNHFLEHSDNEVFNLLYENDPRLWEDSEVILRINRELINFSRDVDGNIQKYFSPEQIGVLQELYTTDTGARIPFGQYIFEELSKYHGYYVDANGVIHPTEDPVDDDMYEGGRKYNTFKKYTIKLKHTKKNTKRLRKTRKITKRPKYIRKNVTKTRQ
jgi:hypothetical protein